MKNHAMKHYLMAGIMIFSVLTAHNSMAQSDLEGRVKKLEEYVTSFEPTLSRFANDLRTSMQDYTKNLEESLNDYSSKLQQGLEDRINRDNNKVIVLDIASKVFQRIETNAGTFLIYVDKISPIDNGFRLNIYIGNPYFANFKDFRLRLVHGQKFPQKGVLSYDTWRSTLLGAEYSFNGTLEKGKWTPIAVDVTASGTKDIEYIECELFVSSVELDMKK